MQDKVGIGSRRRGSLVEPADFEEFVYEVFTCEELADGSRWIRGVSGRGLQFPGTDSGLSAQLPYARRLIVTLTNPEKPNRPADSPYSLWRRWWERCGRHA